MKAEYKRDLQNNYLIMEAQEEKDTEDYCVRMVEQNKISGLLPFRRSRTDGVMSLSYEISGKQSIASLYETKFFLSSDILALLTGLSGQLDILQKYLLSPEKLIFDPAYIFMEPERGSIWFCYAPGVVQDTSVSMLAEFILKRLNHQENAAVRIGYRFYEKTQEENFGLQKSLKELLAEFQAESAESEIPPASVRPPYLVEHMQRGEHRFQEPAPDKEQMEYDPHARSRDDAEEEKQDGQYVRGRERIAAQNFRVVHPAVLFTTVLFLSVLAAVFWFGYLSITEAGGVFFLILSAELLVNSYWRKAKEQKEKGNFSAWIEEDEEADEEYRQLREELYDRADQPLRGKGSIGTDAASEFRYDREKPDRYGERMKAAGYERRKAGGYEQWKVGGNTSGKNSSNGREPIGETCCLTELVDGAEIRLIHMPALGMSGESQGSFPDILLKEGTITIGKLQPQCEILLHTQAVSRIHARLENRQGRCFVRDLNSRNGTFLNGERLTPQELREFSDGDRIAFADLQYRVVKL